MNLPENTRIENNKVIVSLPTDPATGFAREMQNQEVHFSTHQEKIIVVWVVYWLDEEGERIVGMQRFAPYSVTTFAANDEFVDELGNVVDEDDEIAVMGKYDFLMAAMQVGKNPFELLAEAGIEASENERFDI